MWKGSQLKVIFLQVHSNYLEIWLITSSLSSVTTENFTFAGGDGASFSAAIVSVIATGSDWSLIMPELGNGLTITALPLSMSASERLWGTKLN